MSFISFLIGVAVGGIAMKVYIDKQNESSGEQSQEHPTDTTGLVEDSDLSAVVEITSDGTITIDPSDKEIVTAAIKTLKKSKKRVSMASVARESGLSTYKVSKYKELIEKQK